MFADCTYQNNNDMQNPSTMSKIPGPIDVAQMLDEGPTQPKLKSYPKTVYGVGKTKRMRSFNSSWYNQFNWIEYSKIDDSVYCFPCRLFSFKTNSDLSFVNVGYKNWKNAMSSKGFIRHHNTDEHKKCLIAWLDYKNNKKKNTSVLSQISDQHTKIVSENRRYMKAIIVSLRMLAIQGQAFRGHNENEGSVNRGNFIEMMNCIGLFDEVVKNKINGPKNARYLHHSIQAEIIQIMTNMILNKIASEVKESVYFSVMADETKDISKTEQFSVVVRYYFQGELKERFLGFTPLTDLDSTSLFLHIKSILFKSKIDILNCIAQTYDGASVMRGHINGVQALFRKEVPQALYTHCANHRLNLVLVDVTKNIEQVEVFFNFLQELYVFMSSSVIHNKFKDLQKKILKTNKPIELKRLCLTRWSSQIYCCRAIKSTLNIILLLLNNVNAKGLLKKIDFQFIYLLLLFNDFLSQINIVSKYFQDVSADMIKGMSLIESTKMYFLDLRNQDSHKKFYDEAIAIASKSNIGLPIMHVKQKRLKKIPKDLEVFICESSTLEKKPLISEKEFQTDLYYSILDNIISELDKRFTNNSDILCGISAFNPKGNHFLDYDLIVPLANHYSCDLESLKAELKIIKKSINVYEEKFKLKITDVFIFHAFLCEYQIAFTEMFKLCSISITIPISSSACERTFSCLKRIKSYLRNSLLDNNLSNLSVISVEKSEAKLLDIDEIIDTFSNSHNNRRIILK